MSGSPGADELHLSEEEEESLLGQLWDMLGASDDVGSSGAGTAGRGSFAPGLTLTSPDGSGGPIDTSGMGPLEFGQAFIAAVRTGAGRGRGRRPLMRVDCCLRLVGRCAGWGRVHHNLRSCRSCSSPNSPNQCLVLFQWWPHLLGTLTPARRALLARATATSSPTPQPLLLPPPPSPFRLTGQSRGLWLFWRSTLSALCLSLLRGGGQVPRLHCSWCLVGLSAQAEIPLSVLAVSLTYSILFPPSCACTGSADTQRAGRTKLAVRWHTLGTRRPC